MDLQLCFRPSVLPRVLWAVQKRFEGQGRCENCKFGMAESAENSDASRSKICCFRHEAFRQYLGQVMENCVHLWATTTPYGFSLPSWWRVAVQWPPGWILSPGPQASDWSRRLSSSCCWVCGKKDHQGGAFWRKFETTGGFTGNARSTTLKANPHRPRIGIRPKLRGWIANDNSCAQLGLPSVKL